MGNQSSVLYRGERDAFISLDEHDDDRQHATPSLPVRPKVSRRASSRDSKSPPSVVSSSDSSYGTCGSSTLGQAEKYHQSSYQKPSLTISTNEAQTAHQRRESELSQASIFDCVKTPNNAHIRRESSSSVGSLFQSCRRPSEDDNGYTYHRSDSARSSGSQSFTFSNHHSRNSLTSNVSGGSRLSFPDYTEEELNMIDGDEPTFDSDLRRVRNYHVVTTAALPWLTGTAVNPLLRAAYLLRRNKALLEIQQMQSKETELKQLEIDTSLLVDNEENFVTPLAEEKFTTALSSSSSCSSLEYSFFSFPEVTTSLNGGRVSISPLENGSLTPDDTPLHHDGKQVRPNESISKLTEPHHCDAEGHVTLVVPWLQDKKDRLMLYGNTTTFDSSDEQEQYIRNWLANEAGMAVESKDLRIVWYPARFHTYANSIFALGDICDMIPDEDADVCICEEPEHLNWYRSPGSASWTAKFNHVVGVIHTNYKAYVRDHAPAGFLASPLTAGVNSLVVKANCHRVIKLSDVLQSFVPGKEVVENVHGIRDTYLNEGRRVCSTQPAASGKRKAYFVGKLIWGKGFSELLELQSRFHKSTGNYFAIDIFGSGNDELEIQRAFNKEQRNDGYMFKSLGTKGEKLPVNFMGKTDHATLAGDDYSILINPSITEVLCTTTAEAIAMNKFVIIPSHPSNDFFEQFPNCLVYRSRKEFVSVLQHATSNSPPLLSEEHFRILSWEMATLRCVSAAAVPRRDAAREERLRRLKEGKSIKKAVSGIFQKED